MHLKHVAYWTSKLSLTYLKGAQNNYICLYLPAAAAAKSLQSCPTLCDPIDGSPPGFPVPGILQARTLEWVAISFSNAWKGKVKVKSLSRFRLFVTPWSAAYQAPPSMGFSRQEYWSGVPLPSPYICLHRAYFIIGLYDNRCLYLIYSPLIVWLTRNYGSQPLPASREISP